MGIRRIGGPGMHGIGGVPLSSLAGGPMGGPWWDPNNEVLCVWAAYQAKGAASFAASLIDLSGNGNNATDPGGAATPAWAAATGWTFDGIGDYLTTTFVGQNDQSQSILCQFTNYTSSGAVFLFGSNDGVNRRLSIRPWTGGNTVLYENGNSAAFGAQHVAGNLAVAGSQGYRDGVAEGAAVGAWAGACTQPVYIGCWNNLGAPGGYGACNMQAIAIYDCTLTGTQVAAIVTRMSAL